MIIIVPDKWCGGQTDTVNCMLYVCVCVYAFECVRVILHLGLLGSDLVILNVIDNLQIHFSVALSCPVRFSNKLHLIIMFSFMF